MYRGMKYNKIPNCNSYCKNTTAWIRMCVLFKMYNVVQFLGMFTNALTKARVRSFLQSCSIAALSLEESKLSRE